VAVEVVKGIAEGCRQSGCALIGGETAEMAGFYQRGEFDLAGFAVGVVEEDDLIDGSRTQPGDVVLGLKSTGIHSNGYSLVRRVILEQMGLGVHDKLPGMNLTVAEEVLKPTRIYVKAALAMAATGGVRGYVHITGGGFYDNIPRVLPEGCMVRIRRGSFPVPQIFDILAKYGEVSTDEMYRVFNMGIGFVVIARPDSVAAIKAAAAEHGEEVFEIGTVEKTGDAPHVVME